MGLLQTIGSIQNVKMGRLPNSCRFYMKIFITAIDHNHTSWGPISVSGITSSRAQRAWFSTTMSSNVQSKDIRGDRLTLD